MTAGRTRDRRASSSASSSRASAGRTGASMRPSTLRARFSTRARSITGRASRPGPSRSRPRRRSRAAGRTRWARPAGRGVDLGRRCIVQILDADHERAAFRAVDHHGAGAAELHDRPLDQGRGGIVGQAQAQAHHRITQANRLKSGGRRRSFGAKRPQSHASGLFSPYHRALPIPNSIDAMAAMPDQWVCLQRSLGSTA